MRVEEHLSPHQVLEIDGVMDLIGRLNVVQQIDLHGRLTTLVFPPNKADEATAWAFVIILGVAVLLGIIACGPEAIVWLIRQLIQWRGLFQ